MTRSFLLFSAFLLAFAPAAQAQYAEPMYSGNQEPTRYPALGQGDTSPGSPNLPAKLELTVAAGVGIQPEFPGASDYEAVFKPAVHMDYNNALFLVIDRQSMMTPYEGLGYKMIATQDFSAGFNLTYDAGRDAQGDIRGLQDVDWTAMGGVFAAYHPGMFYVRGQLAQDLMDEFGGYKGEFGLGVSGAISPSWRGMIDVHTAFAGDSYNEAYFGVSGAQSAATGLATSNPDGGFYKTGIAGTLQYQFTQGAFLQGIVSYDKLVGDAADSSVSRDDGQLGLQAMVGYRF